MSRISLNMIELLGKQYRHETENSLRYYQRAAFADMIGLSNIALFFKGQAEGERRHADAVMKFSVDRNVIIPISGLVFDDPDFTADSDVKTLFASALDIEQETTAMLEAMLELSRIERDYMAEQWLIDGSGLIKEQVEEESLYVTILDRIGQMASPTLIHDLDVWIGEEFVGK